MIEDVKRLLAEDANVGKLLKAVLANPCAEQQVLAECTGLATEILEPLLKRLEDRLVVLELTTQADSSLESRVPRKIYMINPELEQKVPELL